MRVLWLVLTLQFVAEAFLSTFKRPSTCHQPDSQLAIKRTNGFILRQAYDYQDDQGGNQNYQPRENSFPPRTDICKIFVTGVIGTELKEAYLKDDQYVINFPIAISGHFLPINAMEKNKASAAMWIGVEVWNEEAKRIIGNYNKGSKIGGMGTLLFSKFTDKVTGVERKVFKIRLLKVMDEDDIKNIVGVEEEVDAESDFESMPYMDQTIEEEPMMMPEPKQQYIPPAGVRRGIPEPTTPRRNVNNAYPPKYGNAPMPNTQQQQGSNNRAPGSTPGTSSKLLF